MTAHARLCEEHSAEWERTAAGFVQSTKRAPPVHYNTLKARVFFARSSLRDETAPITIVRDEFQLHNTQGNRQGERARSESSSPGRPTGPPRAQCSPQSSFEIIESL